MTTLRRAAISAIAVLSVACQAHFKPAPETPPPPLVQRRAKLENFATYAEHPELLVGKVIVVAKKAAQCPTGRTFDADYLGIKSYLKADAVIQPRSLSSLIYQGSLKRGGDFDTVVATFGLNLSGTVAAEVIVTDVREALGDPYLDLSAVQQLETTPLAADECDRILVRNVRVSLVHYKLFQQAKSKLDFTGTAFGFGTDVYEEGSQFQADMIVSLDIAHVAPSNKFAAQAEAEHAIVRMPTGTIPSTQKY